MSSLNNFFDLDIDPEEKPDDKEDPSIEVLKSIVDKYKKSPFYLKEEEAKIMYGCYMNSHVLKKYGAENITRFLECHKNNWRRVWNKIHEQQNELQVQLHQTGEDK